MTLLSFQDLPIPGAWMGSARRVMAFGISPFGIFVVGTVLSRTGDSRWFTLHRFPPFGPASWNAVLGPETNASGRGINDLGDLVGFVLQGGVELSCLRLHGAAGISDFPVAGATPGACRVALGINNARAVVGSFTPHGSSAADGFVASALLGGAEARAVSNGLLLAGSEEAMAVRGINPQGDLVGTLRRTGGRTQRGFVFLRPEGRWVDVSADPFFNGSTSVTVNGINASRMIVGSYEESGFYGWVRPDGGLLGLTTVHRFPPRPGQPPRSTALGGVSEFGVMVGTYDGLHPFLCQLGLFPPMS